METTNDLDQQIDTMLAEAVECFALNASCLKNFLSDHSEETEVGKIIRMLLRWERGEIGKAGYRLFRDIIRFNSPCALNDIASFVGHDLLDDGGVGLSFDAQGYRVFKHSDDTVNHAVILAAMESAENEYKQAQNKRRAAPLRALISFLERRDLPVPQSIRDKVVALEKWPPSESVDNESLT